MSKLTLALVAHDHKKPELLAWVKQHIDVLKQCNLVGTGTTGGLIASETGLDVTRYKSGPLGGVVFSMECTCSLYASHGRFGNYVTAFPIT